MTHEPDADRGLNHVVSTAVLIGVGAAVVAGAAIWLLLTEPVTIVNAVVTGDTSPLVRQFAQVIYETIARLLDYL
jgi:hypothetical protein